MDIQKKLEELKNAIEQSRDEIALKAHLGKADAAVELAKLEKRWEELKQQIKPYTDNVEKKAGDAGAALELAAEELKSAFAKIKNIL